MSTRGRAAVGLRMLSDKNDVAGSICPRFAKTVYVLGAGFSKPAGAPSQAEILGDIFAHDDSPVLESMRQCLREFLERDLGLGPDQISAAQLEDIYTPIDRCIAAGMSFKSRSAAELGRIREALGSLISQAISQRILRNQAGHPDAGNYIRQFATYLVDKAKYRGRLAKTSGTATAAKEYDPFAVISLNWDTLLDNELHAALCEDDPRTGDYDPFGVVDYCCYISSFTADPRIRAGLFTLGCGGYNVKLLKLHGSMNWLQCPNCQRLFVDFGETQLILRNIGNSLCRHCRKCGLENHLQGSLVMPTFLKDLSNFQIKLIWQNAGVELMEATHLVFIGYSLPYADFEFRQLLSRMVHAEATIDVVLYEGNDDDASRRYRDEVERYRQFFGRREIRFYASGACDYVRGLHAAAKPADAGRS